MNKWRCFRMSFTELFLLSAMMYPEFQYRPPPPSYQASMQEYRLRLLLLDRQQGSAPSTGSALSPVSPPPTYRSHTTATSGTLHSRYSPSYHIEFIWLANFFLIVFKKIWLFLYMHVMCIYVYFNIRGGLTIKVGLYLLYRISLAQFKLMGGDKISSGWLE